MSKTTDEVADRTVVYLGNRAAVEVLPHPDQDLHDKHAAEGKAAPVVRNTLPGKRCTTIMLAPGLTLMEAAYDITHSTRGVWQAHSDADAPAWVASTDPVLAQLLASHWGCELRDPEPDQQPAAAGDEPVEG